MICDVEGCGAVATIKHHIRYFPEETTGVCDQCHFDIHSELYPKLTEKYIKYNKGDPQAYYEQKERMAKFWSKP